MPSAPKALAQPSLADRLSQVVLGKDTADYQSQSMTELAQWKIRFGQAKKNMTFEQLMTEDPKYVQGFLRRYETKGIPGHQPFLRYVHLYLEHQEKQKGSQKSPTTENKKTQGAIEIDLSSDSEWSEANTLQPPSRSSTKKAMAMQGEMENQNQRINNIEQVVNSLASQMSQMTEALRASMNLPNQ